MRIYKLNSEQWLARPLEEVFSFFADARNLEAITPPWLRFQMVTAGDIRMGCGTRIDYRIRLHGFRMRWQSEITVWDPPFRFVDEQRRGPYRLWIHDHRFESRGAGTVVFDQVTYSVPGGALVRSLFVKHRLERIFSHRRQRLAEILT